MATMGPLVSASSHDVAAKARSTDRPQADCSALAETIADTEIVGPPHAVNSFHREVRPQFLHLDRDRADNRARLFSIGGHHSTAPGNDGSGRRRRPVSTSTADGKCRPALWCEPCRAWRRLSALHPPISVIRPAIEGQAEVDLFTTRPG